MRYKVFSELTYEVYSSTVFFLNIKASQTLNQIINNELFVISNGIEYSEFSLKNSSTRFVKFEVPKNTVFTVNYSAEIDVLYRQIDTDSLIEDVPIIELDSEVLPYISPSRHCESDKFLKLATKEFGYLKNNFEKVKAINDWIYLNVEYNPGTSTSSTSAYDTYIQREGVCKDFAHLAIALCRALDIPARYFTGYAYQLFPPDIHACFEAYLGNEWILFDATKLAPLNGMVKIANGKDATDAPVASFYGNTYCTNMSINCEALDLFTPIDTGLTNSDYLALAY